MQIATALIKIVDIKITDEAQMMWQNVPTRNDKVHCNLELVLVHIIFDNTDKKFTLKYYVTY